MATTISKQLEMVIYLYHTEIKKKESLFWRIKSVFLLNRLKKKIIR